MWHTNQNILEIWSEGFEGFEIGPFPSAEVHEILDLGISVQSGQFRMVVRVGISGSLRNQPLIGCFWPGMPGSNLLSDFIRWCNTSGIN